MILRTGRSLLKNRGASSGVKAFTLVEILVTLVILSSGIVLLFRTFLTSLDQMTALTTRLYATVILDNDLAYMQRVLGTYAVLPLDLNRSQTVKVGEKKITYQEDLQIDEISEFDKLYHVTMTLSWVIGGKTMSLSRSAYIYGFKTTP